MQIYLDFLEHIIQEGVDKEDRTQTGVRSVFSYDMRFNLQKGFPLLTTKAIHIPSVVHELLWFLSGDTSIHYLKENKVRIWDPWADASGELGPVYGKQWRAWESHDGEKIDQIHNVLKQIQENPDSRRLIVSAWNVADLEKMALPPCHAFFQFYVAKNRLSCKLTQRSADAFLGVPFNIASYALLTHMLAHQCDLAVGELIWSGEDCHIYKNHFSAVQAQLQRKPKPLPVLKILRKPGSLFSYKIEDFVFEGYMPDSKISAKIAV